ncbi:MAG: MipA/OmpV family protein [Kordiimonadaceae bacterium]|nr:MipA/OmpV family protein [Kordiimonadaceae bacterium]MBT6035067.1 MipA/OmpV family protein [Kordiimonadaceae bacterium]MBT6330339.1 MipA/OmpV family protein [Kordiimonadaceae bacterium]
MFKTIILTTAMLLIPVTTFAQEETPQLPEEDFGLWNYKKLLLDENGKWSVGTGALIRNSPFRGEKISAFPFPLIDYSSKNLFIREFKTGYHIKAVDDPYKGGYFLDTYLGARMRPGDARQKFSVDAGLRAGYQHPFGSFSLSFTQDMTGASDGKEASAAYSFTFLSKSKKHIVIPRITVTWQDRKMANYLWGISEETTSKMIENNDAVVLAPYTIDRSVVNYSAGIIHIYKLDQNWSSILGAQLAILDEYIMDNPAIERQFDYSFIVGAAYTF